MQECGRRAGNLPCNGARNESVRRLRGLMPRQSGRNLPCNGAIRRNKSKSNGLLFSTKMEIIFSPSHRLSKTFDSLTKSTFKKILTFQGEGFQPHIKDNNANISSHRHLLQERTQVAPARRSARTVSVQPCLNALQPPKQPWPATLVRQHPTREVQQTGLGVEAR